MVYSLTLVLVHGDDEVVVIGDEEGVVGHAVRAGARGIREGGALRAIEVNTTNTLLNSPLDPSNAFAKNTRGCRKRAGARGAG